MDVKAKTLKKNHIPILHLCLQLLQLMTILKLPHEAEFLFYKSTTWEFFSKSKILQLEKLQMAEKSHFHLRSEQPKKKKSTRTKDSVFQLPSPKKLSQTERLAVLKERKIGILFDLEELILPLASVPQEEEFSPVHFTPQLQIPSSQWAPPHNT